MSTPSHQHPQRIHYLAVAALLLFFCLFADSSSSSFSSSSISSPPADDACTSNRWVVVSVSASDSDVPTREQLREHYRGLRGWCLVVVLGSDTVPSFPNDDDNNGNTPATLELDAQSAPSPHGQGGVAVAPAASRRRRRRQISRHRRHATPPVRGYDASGELVAITHAASSVECGEGCLDRTCTLQGARLHPVGCRAHVYHPASLTPPPAPHACAFHASSPRCSSILSLTIATCNKLNALK